MAEMLGAVASGLGIASFAIQIVNSIQEIKNFFESVKEAPEDIKIAIRHIEILSNIFSDIRFGDEIRHISPATALECSELCRSCLNVLKDVVTDSQRCITMHRRFGAVKFVLQKEKLEKLTKRLESAQFMLLISYQTYLGALEKARFDIQQELALHHQRELAELKAALNQPSGTSIWTQQMSPVSHQPRTCSSSISKLEGLGRQSEDQSKVLKRQKKLIARLRTPLWFYNTVWDFCCYRASSGWTTTFRVYNVVPVNSPVMRFAREGDVKNLQLLFASGKASPFDVDQYNEDPLHEALRYHKSDACRFLLEQGVDPNFSRYSTILRVATASPFAMEQYKKSDKSLINLFRFLLPYLDHDVLNSGSSIVGGYMFMSLEAFKWLIQNISTPFRERDLQERFYISLRTAESVCNRPEFVRYIRFLLSGQKIDSIVAAAQDTFNRSFLHFAAVNFGLQYHQKIQEKSMPVNHGTIGDFASWSEMDRNDLFILIRSLAKASCAHTLHQKASYSHTLHQKSIIYDAALYTPLMAVFRAIYGNFNGFHSEKKQQSGNSDWKTQLTLFQTGMRAWLELLQQAGINLEEYGRREFWHHLKGRVSPECLFFDLSNRRKAAEYRKAMKENDRMAMDSWIFCKLRLVSFQYGSLPSDWHFWVTEVMGEHFLEFWNMVDHPERAIPGAWDESKESYLEEQDIDYEISSTRLDDEDCLDCGCGTLKSKRDGD